MNSFVKESELIDEIREDYEKAVAKYHDSGSEWDYYVMVALFNHLQIALQKQAEMRN